MELVINKEFLDVVIAFSLLSGIGSFCQGVKNGKLKQGIIDFLTEIILAVVAGLFTAYLLESQGVERTYIVAAVLIASNNGSDVLNTIKDQSTKRFKKYFNGD